MVGQVADWFYSCGLARPPAPPLPPDLLRDLVIVHILGPL